MKNQYYCNYLIDDNTHNDIVGYIHIRTYLMKLTAVMEIPYIIRHVCFNRMWLGIPERNHHYLRNIIISRRVYLYSQQSLSSFVSSSCIRRQRQTKYYYWLSTFEYIFQKRTSLIQFSLSNNSTRYIMKDDTQ